MRTTPDFPTSRPTASAPERAHDPVRAPSHYRGATGLQSIDITEAYRLGPHLTQAVDYLLRAGRKTTDPRQDLAKAAWYLRRALRRRRDFVFGVPPAAGLPKPSAIAADFALGPGRTLALGLILRPDPDVGDIEAAAVAIEAEIERVTQVGLPPATDGRSA